MQTTNQRSFGTYIYKVLKNVHPSAGMSTPAMDAMDSTMRIVANRLGAQAREFTRGEKLKTISNREVQGAVQALLTGELSRHAVNEGTKAVTKFQTSVTPSDKDSTTSMSAPKQTRESRAGLVFSVSLVETYLRDRGCNVGAGAPVYLASVLEYLSAELLELAGNVSRDDKKKRVKVEHLQTAISNDDELNNFFTSMNIVILGGGVVPHIDQRLLDARKNRKRVPSKGVNSVHRFRPGTVALRKIRSYQKSTEKQLCKVHMHNACDKVLREHLVDVRMTHEARVAIHTLVEQKVVECFQVVNELCLHANRQTVSDADFSLYFKLNNITPVEDEDFEFKEPGVRRLAQRAGIIRMGKETWKQAVGYIGFILHNYLQNATIVMQLQRRTVINVKVLSESLSLRGLELAVVARKIRRRKAGSETASNLDKTAVGETVEEGEEGEELPVGDGDEDGESVVDEDGLVEEVTEDVVDEKKSTKCAPPRSRVRKSATKTPRRQAVSTK
jgi:histone H2A